MPATQAVSGQKSTFKLFSPDEEKTLDLFPGASEPTPEQQRIMNPLSEFGARIARDYADRTISAEDRRRASTEMTAVEFYERFMAAARRKELDPKTVRLDYDALAWFASVGVPEEWPPLVPWNGPPIGCITSGWIDSLVEESLLNGLAANTIGKYLRHLRTIFNKAHTLNLIPKLTVTIPSEEPEARPFTDSEVERIYHGLVECPPMQVAFVLDLATGPRFGDLFWLDWQQIDLERRLICFTAEKTDKPHVLPLTDLVIRHLNRLPRHEAPFATLVDQTLAPEFRAEHYQSRRLNAKWRTLTGFPAPPRLKKLRPENAVPHPWHSARATAAAWIERVAAGMASRLLGHTVEQAGEKTTRKHYLPAGMVPTVPKDLRDAAEAVAWPAYFSRLIEPRQLRLF